MTFFDFVFVVCINVKHSRIRHLSEKHSKEIYIYKKRKGKEGDSVYVCVGVFFRGQKYHWLCFRIH